MAYTVGEVEVNVLPNAKTFNDRLAAQVNPQADKLGQQIGDTLAKQIAQGIRKGLGDFPSDNPAKDPAKRKGDEAAGAFGDAFKARLKAAMADLPDIKIGADSSAADRALAAVRADMQSLHDARIGIDLSDAEALAKLDELKARLAEIGASSDSARVKVDTGSALAELAAFQAEMDKINGETSTAKVKVDTSDSYSGVSSLIGALAMVSPAIVPIGAAAISGGMALTAMGAAGLGAAGVLAIAFKGVGDAVKLLGQQQTQQAAADASAGAGAAARAQAIVAAQRQMQSAQMSLGDAQRAAAQQEVSDAQAVASAQTSLADARRNAANQQLSDARAVETAQHSLAQANNQVELAQLALTAAQEAGRRELESYANNAADAALAQQQAALTLQETQVAAAKTMASSTATDLQKRQASLDVAKAQQSLTEANQRATESAKDNTKAQAAGVDGTQAVVSAQKQVTTAQDAQQKAAQGLSDAQRKAAQDQVTSQESIAKAAQALSNAQQKSAADQITSHESIVRAQQGVAAAADAMAAAQRASAGTTNAALQATNDKIAKLDPTTRAFAEYLRGTWKPIWDQVQSAAAGGLLPGVQTGLEHLAPVMPGITSLVGGLAKAMGDLFAQAGAALAGPFWQHFITDIGQTAPGLLTQLVTSLGNVAKGFAGIVDAFLPMDAQIGSGLVDLTAKFAAWGAGLAQSQGFKDFVTYVQTEWPVVKDIIENVGTAIGHLIQAGGILGGPTLEILRTVSGILANLPVGVVAAMVAAFEGFKIAQTVAGPVQAVSKALSGMGGKLEGKTGLLGSLGSGMTGVAAAAGPAAAGIGFTVLAAQEWVQAGAAAKDVAVALGRALEEGGNQANAAAAYIDKYRGVTDLLNHSAGLGDVKFLGTSFRDLIPSAQGAKTAYDDWYKALSPGQKMTEDVSKAQQHLADVLADPNHTAAQASQAASDYQGALARQKSVQDGVNQALETHLQRLQEIANQELAASNSALASQMAQMQLKDAYDRLNAGIADGTLKGNALKEAQLALGQQAIQTAEAAAKQAADQAKANGATDTGNVSNQAMLKSLQENAKYLTGDAKAAVEKQIEILQNATINTDNFSGAATQMGLNVVGQWTGSTAIVKDATAAQIQDMKDLGWQVTNLPNGKIVVDADTSPARQQIAGLLGAMGSLPVVGGFASTAAAAAQILIQNAPKKATGGAISGPGTGTSDSILAALSNGEHVWTAREVQAAGGQDAVSAMRASVLASGNGYAAGGPVDQAGTFIIHDAPEYLAGLRARTQYTPTGPVAAPPGGAVERWRAVVDQVLSLLHQPLAMDNGVLSLIRSESGGNPTAINLTDSNARAGHPSQGLMQTIPTTFRAYAGPYVSRGITDPLANIYAGVNYALQRYGPAMLMAGGRHSGGRYIGYDSGGLVPPGYHALYNGTGGNEVIAPERTFQQVVNQMHDDASGRSGDPMTITGRLEIGGDGLATIVDGRIARADAGARLSASAGSSTAIR